MLNQENDKKRFVFQVIRDEIVRTEIIKAISQEEAEKILSESDPKCSFKFLWIQTPSNFEKPPQYIRLRIFLAFSAIFFITGFVLLLLEMPNYRYFFFAGLACLLVAAIYEWWQSIKN